MNDTPIAVGDADTPSRSPTFRLSLMMLLQYAVWGAWLPILGRYLSGHLHFSSEQIGLIAGTAAAVGAIFAPFIAGQIADRVFSAERFLCISMIVGGVIQFLLAQMQTYEQWLWLSVAYSIVYMPTIAISNGLAFAHLREPDREFPPIRLWGTIGWIAVSWVFPMVWLQTKLQVQPLPPFLVGQELPDAVSRMADAMRFSGILGVAYGLYCLMLPHTPPRKAVEKIAFAKAFGLLRHRGLLVLTLAALPISIIHTIYFIQTPQFLPTLAGVRDSDIQPAMSIGQISEIFVLAALGFFLRKLGFRAVLTIGCLAYLARFAIFSLGAPTWLVVASQALHGVCFSCFYATAFMYVERVAPADVRHSAQTVFGIILLGIGPLLVGPVLGRLSEAAKRPATISECLATPNLIPQEPANPPGESAAAPRGWDKLYPGAAGDIAEYKAEHPNDQSRAWKALRPDTSVTVFDYTRFWRYVAAFGLFSALLIGALFRLDNAARIARGTRVR
jgi:nucleoside transporter